MSKLNSWKRGFNSFERSNQVYKVFIMYGEPKNETDIIYSKPKVLESFDDIYRLRIWFAAQMYTLLCDTMHMQKYGGILKSIEINYHDCRAKVVYINGYTIKYFTEERKQ